MRGKSLWIFFYVPLHTLFPPSPRALHGGRERERERGKEKREKGGREEEEEEDYAVFGAPSSRRPPALLRRRRREKTWLVHTTLLPVLQAGGDHLVSFSQSVRAGRLPTATDFAAAAAAATLILKSALFSLRPHLAEVRRRRRRRRRRRLCPREEVRCNPRSVSQRMRRAGDTGGGGGGGGGGDSSNNNTRRESSTLALSGGGGSLTPSVHPDTLPTTTVYG